MCLRFEIWFRLFRSARKEEQMPTVKELLVSCVASVVVALCMLFILRSFGMEEDAVVIAAISGSMAAVAAAPRRRSAYRRG